eukprot:4472068-Alexandrium_andersonii.AAC.1
MLADGSAAAPPPPPQWQLGPSDAEPGPNVTPAAGLSDAWANWQGPTAVALFDLGASSDEQEFDPGMPD